MTTDTLDSEFLTDLVKRGLLAQMTSEAALSDHISTAARTIYCGFDPTADSLHLGHLVPLLVLKRFQQAGHRPVALVGGATGLIGDPSFKAAERQLNTPDIVAAWTEKIASQVSQFIDFDCGANAAVVVNNLDWAGSMNMLDFLRDVGKHFSVNAMVNKESVRQRIDRDGAGISFTEFAYALLQALDFAELNRRYDCTMQIGGSDQWGNIVGGIDLVRRQNQRQAYGLTVPLVTKADGSKFGKTEAGTVWLAPAKTSPYAFYQFWLNAADADVYKFLRYFTFLSEHRIQAIQRDDAERQGRPQAQQILAAEVTGLVHGAAAVAAARRITESLFSGDVTSLTAPELAQLAQDGLPATVFAANAPSNAVPLTTLFVEAGLAKTGKQVKDALGRNAVQVNGKAIGLDANMQAAAVFARNKALAGRYFVVRMGKKNYHIFSR